LTRVAEVPAFGDIRFITRHEKRARITSHALDVFEHALVRLFSQSEIHRSFFTSHYFSFSYTKFICIFLLSVSYSRSAFIQRRDWKCHNPNPPHYHWRRDKNSIPSSSGSGIQTFYTTHPMRRRLKNSPRLLRESKCLFQTPNGMLNHRRFYSLTNARVTASGLCAITRRSVLAVWSG